MHDPKCEMGARPENGLCSEYSIVICTAGIFFEREEGRSSRQIRLPARIGKRKEGRQCMGLPYGRDFHLEFTGKTLERGATGKRIHLMDQPVQLCLNSIGHPLSPMPLSREGDRGNA